MRRRVWWPLAAVLFLGACNRGADGDAAADGEGGEAEAREVATAEIGTLPPGVTREVAEEGRKLYAGSCVVCHGENGGGNQLGPSLVDAEWVHAQGGSLESIAQVVRAGVAEPQKYGVPMQPYEGLLNAEQIRAVSAYTFSLRGR